ncbi:autophagy-related protein 13b-like [Trifolium pratense]|uniref:autophagy-related protein 13b-like n=1 Tax=Trifolium pratense TaxID=57577 RepID=UPI001E69239C|nr:autophagy-related protein 13b-like [Trifolium pratense]
MVSSHGNAHSDTARMEQIITEFFAKSVHIILESRALYASSRNSYGGYKSDSSSSSSSSSVRPRDKWFNLALRECPVALENINNHECVIVDVILVHRSLDWDPMITKKVLCKERYPLCCSGAELGVDAKSEKIVERWIVQYENGKKIKNSNLGTRRSSNNSLQNLYKKSTLLLRSLYATVRLLPAYKTFRDLNSSAHIRPFTLAHRVSSFVEPFTRKQESEMMKYRFTPVDTSSGRLCLTVMYCPTASDLSCEQLPSMSPQVISDYVGSPLASPLRRFPSLPLSGLPCHGCSSPRRHSWNFDDSKASSTYINDSSLPLHSKSQILLSNTSSRLHDLPPNPHLRGSRCTYKIDRNTNVMQTGATSEKVFSLGKDELQKNSGVRISANSFPFPRISISSRFYLDDFDDTDFSCPFDVDNDDMKNPGSRTKSLDRGHVAEALEAGGFFPIRKSNYAAVGALVHMLKKAPPLHQDFYTSEHPSVQCGGLRLTAIPSLRDNRTTKPMKISVQKPNKENLSHGTHCETRNNIQELNKNQQASISTRKTTRDALEEFHGYREMKNLLVMRDIKPQI